MKTHTLTRLLAAVPSLALIAYLAACVTTGGLEKGGEGPSSGGSGSGDPKTAVVKAFQQLSAKPYRLHETTTMAGPGGQSMTTSRVMEFVPPNRYHATLNSSEMIFIGDDYYQKLGGTWSKIPRPGKRDANQQVGTQIRQAIDSGALTVTLVGNDSVDGKPGRLYRIAGSMRIGETDVKGEYKVWLNAAEDWPLKLVGKGESPYPMETVITYEQDPTIRIEAPIP